MKFPRLKTGLLFGICMVFTVTYSCVAQKQYTVKKPNVIIIMADDLGYNDVGFLNKTTYNLTPTIDSLAANSMVFTNYYAMPTCSPSRSSLMTGLYPSKHGVYAVDAFAHTPDKMRKILGGLSLKEVAADTWTMPLMFKNAGYHTSLIGKWHLGQKVFLYRGKAIFDDIIGTTRGGDEGNVESYFPPYGRKIEFPEDANAPAYMTDRLTYEAVKSIRENKDRPFFMYLAHYAPHVPLQAKKEDVTLFKNRTPFGLQNRAVYGAMVYAVDRSLKTIISELRAQGILNNTIILFTSDNGAQIMSSSNMPYMGQKGEVHEGGVKVPAFIWYKGVKAGKNNQLASIVDILPTLASLANLQIPESVAYDGKNWFDKDMDWKNRSIFFHNPGYTGNGKTNALVWQTPASVIHKGNWKLIQSLEDDRLELYNLAKDPTESKNVSEQNPRLVKSLLAELKSWQKNSNALMPKKINIAYDPKSREWINKKDTRLPKDNTNILIK